MKLTLITYSSTIIHNAGYAHTGKAVEFITILSELIEKFSEATKVKKEEICWMLVTNSDWIDRCLLIYAPVSTDWKITQNTHVVDESFDTNWWGHIAIDFWSWVEGRGKGVDITKSPPLRSHDLFRSINNTISKK